MTTRSVTTCDYCDAYIPEKTPYLHVVVRKYPEVVTAEVDLCTKCFCKVPLDQLQGKGTFRWHKPY